MQSVRQSRPVFPIEVSEQLYNRIETTLQFTLAHVVHLPIFIFKDLTQKRASTLNFHSPSKELAQFATFSCALVAITTISACMGYDFGTVLTKKLFRIRSN